jgi:hypothetical protein
MVGATFQFTMPMEASRQLRPGKALGIVLLTCLDSPAFSPELAFRLRCISKRPGWIPLTRTKYAVTSERAGRRLSTFRRSVQN